MYCIDFNGFGNQMDGPYPYASMQASMLQVSTNEGVLYVEILWVHFIQKFGGCALFRNIVVCSI